MKTEINTIAVIGAGPAGREFALAAVRAGYRTVLEDISENRLDEAIAWIQLAVQKGTQRGAAAGTASAILSANLVAARTMEAALREADLIIETAADEMETKIELFTIFDKFAKPNAIFASNTVSLPIAEMAAVTFCAERCVGLHVFIAPGNSPALGLVYAPETSEETIAACREVGRRMSREVLLIQESQNGAGGDSQQPESSATWKRMGQT
jgi:3-hydroxybutyryl-CoA dehydrogenase